MSPSEKNPQRVQSFFISDEEFDKLVTDKISIDSNQRIINLTNNRKSSPLELQNAQIVYLDHEASKLIETKVKGCEVMLIPENFDENELQENTLYLNNVNGQLSYVSKRSPKGCVLNLDIVPDSVEINQALGMITPDWFEQIKSAVTFSKENQTSQITLSAGNKTTLLDLISVTSNEALNDDYTDLIFKFDSSSFHKKLQNLIPKTNDICIFAIRVIIQSSSQREMTHAVPIIFNKKGEILYYCSIPSNYDREVSELMQVICELLAENNISNLTKHEKIILQKDDSSCTFFTAQSLLSLNANQTLQEQFVPIAEILKECMKDDKSKLELRAYFYDKINKADVSVQEPEQTVNVYSSLPNALFFKQPPVADLHGEPQETQQHGIN